MIAHFVGALSAAAYSVDRARDLHLSLTEWPRYLRKSIHRALRYVGLGTSLGVREAWRAGQAAYLITALDVLTDWHPDPENASIFSGLLSLVPNQDTRTTAMQFFDARARGASGAEGLDGGVTALRLVLQVMGCEAQRLAEWTDFEAVGRTLQLVDDLLDYDEDVARGDLTCLTSPEARTYISELLAHDERGDLRRWFGSDDTVLVRVVNTAVTRARTWTPPQPPQRIQAERR